MPHIVVEYSDNVADDVISSNVCSRLHQVVVDSGLFTPEAVKARALGYSNFTLTGDAKSFVHVTCSILSGRSLEQRKSLNEAVFAELKAILPDIDRLSCDLHEMDAETYCK